MKSGSTILIIGLVLISALALLSIPKSVFAQANTTDYGMTEEEIKAKITDFKTKHPKFAAIVEAIPTLDLKETVKAHIATEALQKMLKFHAWNLVQENMTGQTSSPLEDMEDMMTDEEIQEKITDFKTNHPKFAAVVEGISNLDLKETVKANIAAKALEKMLGFHAKNLVQDKVVAPP